MSGPRASRPAAWLIHAALTVPAAVSATSAIQGPSERGLLRTTAQSAITQTRKSVRASAAKKRGVSRARPIGQPSGPAVEATITRKEKTWQAAASPAPAATSRRARRMSRSTSGSRTSQRRSTRSPRTAPPIATDCPTRPSALR